MTSQSPRIYLYKITFEEVSYYYYGVHKEKKFNEYYMGSPKTNKWCWELYTPKKQILEIFQFSNEGWIEANIVEQRVIKPFYNNDKWCLNESCGKVVSLDILRKNGKKIDSNELKERGNRGRETQRTLQIGLYGLTLEQRRENIKKYSHLGGNKTKEFGVGIHALTTEQRRENGKISAQTNKKNNTGLYGFTTEERRENVKITNSQKWECCITGYVSTAAGVVSYQKGKGIDTSKTNRRRIA
jgi:hypothetical protein